MRFGVFGALGVCLLVLGWITLEKTNYWEKEQPFAEPGIWPAQINLVSGRPLKTDAVWQPRHAAIRTFWSGWCDFPDTLPCDASKDDFEFALQSRDFLSAFAASRQREIESFGAPRLRNADLQDGRLYLAVLPGLGLTDSTLADANLSSAILDGAELRGVDVARADFSQTQMNGVHLSTDQANGATFQNADLVGADLFLAGAGPVDLRGADLTDATLFGDSQSGPITADFSALGRITRLDRTEIAGAQIWWSLFDFSGGPITLHEFNVIGAVPQSYGIYMQPPSFRGTAFRWVDFSELPEDYTAIEGLDDSGDVSSLPLPRDDETIASYWQQALDGSFGDASVTLPDGVYPPCYWSEERLDNDADFYGAWRVVVEATNGTWPPVATLQGRSFRQDGSDIDGKSYADTLARTDLIDQDCEGL